MAERYAVQSGSWQNASTWDGGVSIPGENDDVHAGGYEVTIRDSIKVKSLRTAAGSSAPAGGRFVVGPMDIAPDTVIEVTDGILAAHHQSGNASTSARTYILWVLDAEAEITLVTPTIEGGAGSYRFGVGINVTGSSAPGTGGGDAVTIDVSAGAGLKAGGGTQSMALVVDAGVTGQTVTVLGNITGGTGSNAYGFYMTGGTVDITGDITGGTGSNAYGFYMTGGTVDITGDITGGNAYGFYMTGGTVDITGDITGGTGSNAYGVSVSGGTVDITGDITGGTGSSNAFGVSVSGGTVDITGDITGGTGSSTAYGAYVTSTATPLVITGDLFASTAPAVYLDGSHQTHVTINGNITAGTEPGHAFALRINHTNKQVRVNGTITGTQHARAISSVQTIAPLAISGILSAPITGHWPLDVPTWIIWDAENFEFHTYTDLNWPQDTGNPVAVTRYPAGTPDEADVRQGVPFGQGLIFTGTLTPSTSPALADIAAVTGAQIQAATNND